MYTKIITEIEQKMQSTLDNKQLSELHQVLISVLSTLGYDNTEEETEKRMFSQKLWNIVRSLEEPDCSIIVYQYFYKHKIRETAKILEMTSDSVKKRSMRARKKIGALLRKGGYHE